VSQKKQHQKEAPEPQKSSAVEDQKLKERQLQEEARRLKEVEIFEKEKQMLLLEEEENQKFLLQ